MTSVKGNYDNTANSSPMNSPRCDECFPGYVKTEAATCKWCPINDMENSEGISKGCSRCAPKMVEKKENETPVLEEGIKCIDCRNE